MMMHAYDEIYLNDAMRNLGEAFDYSATVLAIPMDDFLDMFIISGIAEQFALGVPKFVSGLSGTELVWEVLNRTKKNVDFHLKKKRKKRSPRKRKRPERLELEWPVVLKEWERLRRHCSLLNTCSLLESRQLIFK